MIALIAAVFSASVLGSLHCVGMCGAFVAFAVGIDAPGTPGGTPGSRRRSAVGVHAAYHLGRLATYVTLGVIAGSVGGVVNRAGDLAGVQRAAVILAGASMIVFGAAALLRIAGVRVPKAAPPGFMQSAASRLLRFAMTRPPTLRAALTGLTTTLLPCGWLYAFVITAAGTGRPETGALTMAVFWAGTLPALVAVGAGVRALASRLGSLGSKVPAMTACAVIAVGLLNVVNPSRLRAAEALAAPVHADAAAQVERVGSLDSAAAPCCLGKPSADAPADAGESGGTP